MKRPIVFLIVFFSSISNHAQCWQSVHTHSKYQASAIKIDGTLWEWGLFNSGSEYIPFQLENDNDWQMISTGWGFRAALKNDGTLWTWGSNYGGLLGNGSTTAGSFGITQVGTANDWQYVDCSGAQHSVATKSDGSLWSWGNCSTGELGQGSFTNDVATPTKIGEDTDWAFAAVGLKLWYSVGGAANQKGSSVAIKTDGSVWAWGCNEWGQLGDGTMVNKNVPTLIANTSNWAKVSIGGGRTMAVKNDGTLWASGLNEYGQFGNGTTTNSTTFTQIGTETNWQTVDAGQEHTLALKNNGTLWAWGDNERGSLGNGSNVNATFPVQVGSDTDWVSISAGKQSSHAVKSDGSLWAWGTGENGILGIGAVTAPYYKTYPVEVLCQPLATKTFVSEELKVYPNPAKNILNIRIQEAQIEKIIVSEISGKKVMELDGNHQQIDLQPLAKGLYLIQIFSAGKSYNQKFVKE